MHLRQSRYLLDVTNLLLKTREDKANFRTMEHDYFAQRDWIDRNNLDRELVDE